MITNTTVSQMILSLTHLSFLLLARDVGQVKGHATHYVLVVRTDGRLSERKAVLLLMVPESRLDVLAHLKPQMQSFVLV